MKQIGMVFAQAANSELPERSTSGISHPIATPGGYRLVLPGSGLVIALEPPAAMVALHQKYALYLTM